MAIAYYCWSKNITRCHCYGRTNTYSLCGMSSSWSPATRANAAMNTISETNLQLCPFIVHQIYLFIYWFVLLLYRNKSIFWTQSNTHTITIAEHSYTNMCRKDSWTILYVYSLFIIFSCFFFVVLFLVYRFEKCTSPVQICHKLLQILFRNLNYYELCMMFSLWSLLHWSPRGRASNSRKLL